MTEPPSRILAVAYRSLFMATAVLSRSEIIEVRGCHASGGFAAARPRIAARIAKVAAEYDVDRIVVEPGLLAPALLATRGRVVATRTLGEAKAALLCGYPRPTFRDLCQHLVDRYPSVRRLARILPGTGRITMTERWRTILLLSVALGLADLRLPAAKPDEERAVRDDLV